MDGRFRRGSMEDWRIKVQAKPGSILAARGLGRAIVNSIGLERMERSAVDGLLAELRELRARFQRDEQLAEYMVMALANAAEEAVDRSIEERNRGLLAELRSVMGSVEWAECNVSGCEVLVLGAQYLGLLAQRRYGEADRQLEEMTGIAFGGTSSQKLEWLIAVRHGFWVFHEQEEWRRCGEQIELVRDFRRRHPGDDYEAPHAQLAMLLVAFEAAERRGERDGADGFFEEACSLGGVGEDHYGHVERIHNALTRGGLSEAGRGFVLAERMAAFWRLESECGPVQ